MKKLTDFIQRIADWPCWEAFFWGFIGAVFVYLLNRGH